MSLSTTENAGIKDSTRQADATHSPPKTGRLAAASSIGTALEWYDFTVYNIMAALIFNHVFFPSFDPLVGTILAFSTYAVGYVSRPIGGMVFGHLGDVLGRRFVLVTTLVRLTVLHRQQYGTGPLAAQCDTLHKAQRHQQQRTPNPPAGIARQQAH